MRRKIGSLFLCLCLVTGMVLQVWGRVWEGCDVYAAEGDDAVETAGSSETQMLNISASSAILMEAATGQIIYEKDPDEELSPASITKIMTLLLIFDAIGSGKISLEDEVTVSAYAQSMGGSQVYLAEGEVQTVETLIKCIVIASGNDASVAKAE